MSYDITCKSNYSVHNGFIGKPFLIYILWVLLHHKDRVVAIENLWARRPNNLNLDFTQKHCQHLLYSVEQAQKTLAFIKGAEKNKGIKSLKMNYNLGHKIRLIPSVQLTQSLLGLMIHILFPQPSDHLFPSF